METERIKSPEGVKKLMAELWENHIRGQKPRPCHVYMVDLPEPTAEDNHATSANHTTAKPDIMSENELKDALQKASGELGGW